MNELMITGVPTLLSIKAYSISKMSSLTILPPEEFEIPGGYTVPILSAIIIVYLLSHLTNIEKVGIVIFIAILSVIYGLILYFKKKSND